MFSPNIAFLKITAQKLSLAGSTLQISGNNNKNSTEKKAAETVDFNTSQKRLAPSASRTGCFDWLRKTWLWKKLSNFSHYIRCSSPKEKRQPVEVSQLQHLPESEKGAINPDPDSKASLNSVVDYSDTASLNSEEYETPDETTSVCSVEEYLSPATSLLALDSIENSQEIIIPSIKTQTQPVVYLTPHTDMNDGMNDVGYPLSNNLRTTIQSREIISAEERQSILKRVVNIKVFLDDLMEISKAVKNLETEAKLKNGNREPSFLESTAIAQGILKKIGGPMKQFSQHFENETVRNFIENPFSIFNWMKLRRVVINTGQIKNYLTLTLKFEIEENTLLNLMHECENLSQEFDAKKFNRLKEKFIELEKDINVIKAFLEQTIIGNAISPELATAFQKVVQKGTDSADAYPGSIRSNFLTRYFSEKH